MKIETFKNLTLSYKRNVGEYGPQNQVFMQQFIEHLMDVQLYNNQLTILGIALDNPDNTPTNQLRYDIGILSKDYGIEGLHTRPLEDGVYAIFEVEHTEQAVLKFWATLQDTTKNLKVDTTKPIIERYTLEKTNNHLCEFCIPLINE